MRAKLRAVLYRREVIRMCGRFVQYQGVANYLKVLGTDRLVVSGYDNQPIACYNVAPSTRVNILHYQQDDSRFDLNGLPRRLSVNEPKDLADQTIGSDTAPAFTRPPYHLS